jgi:nitrate/TMAO reductase-like tetraheme cytochrome c subunit
LLIASPARSILFEQVQRRVDLRHEALNFIALVRAGVFLEPFQEPLLSRKEFCNSCHRANAASAMKSGAS